MTMEQKHTTAYHKVLERQLRKLFGKGAEIPSEFSALLQIVSDTYKQYEEDRILIEHTMDISSQELSAANNSLMEQKTALEVAYEQLRMTQAQLEESERMLAMAEELHEAYDMLEKQTEQLRQAHIHHNAAIQRAKRIQNAIFPDKKKIAENFREFFIFYQPLNIVSGDFYWYSDKNRENLKILIVADCTGHGVPGAFMTIMGNSLLEEIINTNEITNPKTILEVLDRKITQSLAQGKDSTHDGMDISVIRLDKKRKSITYAGAKHILYHIRNGEMMQIKGSIFPIGGHDIQEKTFENDEIEYEDNDIFYMTTDGYQSQFSDSGKKFMRKRLRETIIEHHHLSLGEQRAKFKFIFADWKGDAKQTDDILVVGFKT
jgi:serine phosphatase RsbU (regulator of sigma subunit)